MQLSPRFFPRPCLRGVSPTRPQGFRCSLCTFLELHLILLQISLAISGKSLPLVIFWLSFCLFKYFTCEYLAQTVLVNSSL